jgi:hypothetical protein
MMTMNETSPTEYFTDLAADLALTIADVLEHPYCPVDLADALNEVANELITALSPSNPDLLRALAGLSASRDGRARPEAETLTVAKSRAKSAALNGASGK